MRGVLIAYWGRDIKCRNAAEAAKNNNILEAASQKRSLPSRRMLYVRAMCVYVCEPPPCAAYVLEINATSVGRKSAPSVKEGKKGIFTRYPQGQFAHI